MQDRLIIMLATTEEREGTNKSSAGKPNFLGASHVESRRFCTERYARPKNALVTKMCCIFNQFNNIPRR